MIRATRGFTIVELAVVITVIAILAAITVVAYNGVQQRARDSRRKSDFATLQKALELYKGDKGGYPACTFNGTYDPTTAGQTCTLPNANVTSQLSNYLSTISSIVDPINNGQGAGQYAYLYAVGWKIGTDGCSNVGYPTNNYEIGVKLETAPAVCTSNGWWSRSDLGLIVGSTN